MNNVKIYIKVFLAIIVILLFEIVNVKTVNATQEINNNSEVNKLNVNSNILIVGDSRVVGISNNDSKGIVSYIAIVGGSYSKKRSPNINDQRRTVLIKEYIDQIIKNKGSCIVVIESTINDYNGNNSNVDGPIRDITSFAQEVANYNKKVKVYVTNLIGQKDLYVEGIKNYNNRLKEEAINSNEKFTYIDITPNNIIYSIDGIHFKSETYNALYQKIITKISPKLKIDNTLKINKKLDENNNVKITISSENNVIEKSNISIYKYHPNMIAKLNNIQLTSTNSNKKYEWTLEQKNIFLGQNKFAFIVKDKNGNLIGETFMINRSKTKIATNSAPYFYNFELGNDNTLKFSVIDGAKKIPMLKVVDLNSNNKTVLQTKDIDSKGVNTLKISDLNNINGKYKIALMANDIAGNNSEKVISFSIE